MVFQDFRASKMQKPLLVSAGRIYLIQRSTTWICLPEPSQEGLWVVKHIVLKSYITLKKNQAPKPTNPQKNQLNPKEQKPTSGLLCPEGHLSSCGRTDASGNGHCRRMALGPEILRGFDVFFCTENRKKTGKNMNRPEILGHVWNGADCKNLDEKPHFGRWEIGSMGRHFSLGS